MAGGSSNKSPRGPLQKFGGPPSKTFFFVKEMLGEIRSKSIMEHYGALWSIYVDLDALNEPEHCFSQTKLS